MKPACPNVMTLNGFVSGTLEERVADEVTDHIKSCDRCRTRVDEMSAQPDTLIGAVRRSVESRQNDDEPELARLISQAQQEGSPAAVGVSDAAAAIDKPKRKHADLDGFVDGLRRSRLIEDQEVERLVNTISAADTDTLAQELVDRDCLTPYQARALTRGRWKGLVLGNYEILDKLGQGGMGQVYKAQHRRMGRIVCLKVLRSSGRRSPEVVERFRREIRALSALDHPNFVVAHDADEAGEIQFLVMEYVEGQDLSRYVAEHGPFSVADATEIVRQVALALTHAHELGVIHRDIKPHNLLLTPSEDYEEGVGQVKVLDMGLARFDSLFAADADSATRADMTATGVIMGTVDYMSPEQALNGRFADARSDIYSLGCTLHFLLTGKPVFYGETIMEKLIAHREQPRPDLRDNASNVPRSLSAVFRRMIAREPDGRYATMDEVTVDIEACLKGRRPQALREPWLDWLEQILRKPIHAAVTAAVLLIAFTTWMLGSPDSDASTAVSGDAASDSGSTGQVSGEFDAVPGDDSGHEDSARQQVVPNSRGKVLVAIAPRGFNRNHFDEVVGTLRDKQIDYDVVSTKIGTVYPPKNEKDWSRLGVKVDGTIQSQRIEDCSDVIFISGNAWEFSHKNGTSWPQIKQLLQKTLDKGGLVASTGDATQPLNDMGFSNCKVKRENGLKIGTPPNCRGRLILAEKTSLVPQLADRVRQEIQSRRKFEKKHASGKRS